ncbi:MAG TPA: tetratricopeptide repeat protein [Clostridiales bacterium]|nr:tetratricopeptide repeat protein [Clostridiales bacterium]
MNKTKKKKISLAGGIAAALIVVIVGALIFNSCSKNSKYEKFYDEAGKYFISGEYEKAIASLEKALDIKDTEEAYLLLAEIYMSMGDIDRAIDVLYVGSYKLDSDAVNKRLEDLKAQKAADYAEGDILIIGGKEVEKDATALILSQMGLTDEDISPLAQMTKLENLSLTDNNITSIAVLSGLGELNFLHLGGNIISDLAPLRGLTKLKTLYLDGNPIRDPSPLYGLTSLTTLSLKNMEVDPEQIKALKEALPGCGIFYDNMEDEEEVKELTLGGVTFASDVTELDLSGLGITDISILSECRNLTKLDLRNNNISDITPLKDLLELNWLCIWNNRVSDIRPLMGLTKLAYLDADNNSITDISAVTFLTNMEELWLSNNSLKSISPLTKLPKLRRLGLKGVGLEDGDLDELMAVATLRELALENNKEISGEKLDALKEALTNCTITHSEALYTAELGGKSYKSNATEISASNAGVSDISTLEKFESLKILILKGNSINSIASLTGLKNLEVLELEENKISDITPLKEHASLRILNLMNNKITDISALSGCSSLTELHLSGNSLDSISALSGLTSLKELSLDYTGISDISALSNLQNLTYLGLEGNSISDISALKQLTELQTLYIGGNQLTAMQLWELAEALPNCSIYSDLDIYSSSVSREEEEPEPSVQIHRWWR